MSHIFNGVALVVAAVGDSVTTGGTTANAAIPNNSNGSKPRFVRVAATAACHVRLGASGVTATADDLMVAPGDAVVLAVPNGVTHFAYIQSASSGTLNVTPLENA